MSEKIILFGGTFDPIHTGHTIVAEAAAEKIGVQTIYLIPARRSPHKQQKPIASDADRIAMLKLATAGKPLFKISPIELNRAEPSYTIDTVRYFKQKSAPHCQLYWLIGADMIKDLPRWHKINELLDECNICTMYRGGFKKPDFKILAGKFSPEKILKLEQNVIETPLIDISSTEIRQKIAHNQDVSKFLHPDVWDYIKRHKLYLPDDQ